MKGALHNYHARMQRVLDHIDRHLEDDLDLDTVSGVAAFSKYHFHRQSTATFGLSVHRYIQLARMKRASYRLAYRDAQSVTDIAMDAGYDTPDAFARAFRQRVGQSPSSFRKAPDWEPWLVAFGPLDNARSKLMQTTYTPDDVTIRNVAPTPVAIMEHRGGPAKIGATIQRFIAWRKATGLSPGPVRLSISSTPIHARRLRPNTAWTFALAPIARLRRMVNGSRPAQSPADAVRCCASSATPTIWSLRHCTFTAIGFPPAVRRRGTFHSTVSASPSSRRCPNMRQLRNCSCR